jgi:suppressor of tumorigenicity protein 13
MWFYQHFLLQLPDPMFNLSAVMSNPANFAKHQANPEVGPIITKMMVKVNHGSQ